MPALCKLNVRFRAHPYVKRSGMKIAFRPDTNTLAEFKPTLAMSAPTLNATIQKQALLLAEEARRTDPSIIKFYWFPAENEVRLVEVATNMQPSLSAEVEPFYFPPAPKHNMHVVSGVALIRDGEDGKLKLPEGWGDWDAAVQLGPEVAE